MCGVPPCDLFGLLSPIGFLPLIFLLGILIIGNAHGQRFALFKLFAFCSWLDYLFLRPLGFLPLVFFLRIVVVGNAHRQGFTLFDLCA